MNYVKVLIPAREPLFLFFSTPIESALALGMAKEIADVVDGSDLASVRLSVWQHCPEIPPVMLPCVGECDLCRAPQGVEHWL